MIGLEPVDAARKSMQLRDIEFRVIELQRADGESVPAVVSTDAVVDVRGTPEILEHTSAAIDLSRAPLPLIESHDTEKLPLGVVEALTVVSGKLRGLVKFGSTARAREILEDVKAGVLRSLSIGYEILKYYLRNDGVRVVTKWRPVEVSCVAAPADIGAGFYRSVRSVMQEHDERDRCAAIVRAARMFDAEDHYEAITSGESASAYRQRAVLKGATRPASLDMSRSELRRYSLTRAIGQLMGGPPRQNSFEWEIHDELRQRHTNEHGGSLTDVNNGCTILLPPDVAFDIVKRDLTAASASGGGYLVGTENAPSWVELARPRSVALSLGVESLDGLRSSLTISRETAGPTIT
jgi:HK97 family phage prohead protease